MISRKQPNDAWSRFAVGVLKLNGLIMQAGEEISRPVGQTSARWQILGRAFEPQTVAKMARDMGHARQSVQRIADILAKEGFVAYVENPADQRARLVTLTPKGMEALTAIYMRQLAWSERIMTKLEPKQLEAAVEMLQDISKVLESDANSHIKETEK